MQRLLVLFLMFLLPLQVFAGGVELRQEQVSVEYTVMPLQQLAVDSACCDFDDLVAEVSTHADIGDESVPILGFHFTNDLILSSLVRKNDQAREPPFLPLLAPPPRA